MIKLAPKPTVDAVLAQTTPSQPAKKGAKAKEAPKKAVPSVTTVAPLEVDPNMSLG